MRKQISCGGTPLYLIDETVPVSAYYRCRACNAYPGQLHVTDHLARVGDTVIVVSLYRCDCGHEHRDEGPTLAADDIVDDTLAALHEYYAYGDDGQQTIEASDIGTAAYIASIPTDEQIADGGWLIVRDEETGEELTFGARPGDR